MSETPNTPIPGRGPKRFQTYDTPEITVTFDPNLCQHTGICLRGLPKVFDIKRRQWIKPELATAEQVAAQVERCPSGALQYIRHKPTDNGPPE